MDEISESVIAREEILAFLSENKPLFCSRYGVDKIGIFGSFARNEQRPDSDIDVVVDFAMPVDLFEVKSTLRKIIGSRFKRNVDICRLKYVNEYARKLLEHEAIYV